MKLKNGNDTLEINMNELHNGMFKRFPYFLSESHRKLTDWILSNKNIEYFNEETQGWEDWRA